jgi:hypothetical protein
MNCLYALVGLPPDGRSDYSRVEEAPAAVVQPRRLGAHAGGLQRLAGPAVGCWNASTRTFDGRRVVSKQQQGPIVIRLNQP